MKQSLFPIAVAGVLCGVLGCLPGRLLADGMPAKGEPAEPRATVRGGPTDTGRLDQLAQLARVLGPGEALPCAGVPLVTYRGTHFTYDRPARIHPSFREHLLAFERVVVRVAIHHFGRPPRRVHHLGTFNCRKMRRYPTWISEHALGNAIDLAGFEFGPLANDSQRELPRRLRRAFSVRVERDFRTRRPALQAHAAFLRDLTRALIARPDIFNVVLGPGYPGHHNHLHLDAAPYRVVDVDLGSAE